MQPGWYPDPYSEGGVRWWDGHAWTEYARSAMQLQPLPSAGSPDLPRDLAVEQRWARIALVAIWVMAAAGIAGFFLAATVLAHDSHVWTDHLNKEIRRLDAGKSTSLNLFPFSAEEVAGFGGILILGILIHLPVQIWLWSAARISRNFGVPARRSPYWGILGFYVPIVNLWYPYQVARDIFAFGDPRRTLVGQWWALWLVSTAWGEAVLNVGLQSEVAGVVFAAVSSVIPVLGAWFSQRLIKQASALHTSWAGR